MVLTDKQEMLLMAYADGELLDQELTEAQALIAAHTGAKTLVHNLTMAKQALQAQVLSDRSVQAVDLSMIRGRVLTKMPLPKGAPSRAAAGVPEKSLQSRFVQWVHGVSGGQWGIAGGLGVAALLLTLVISHDHDTTPHTMDTAAAHDGHDHDGADRGAEAAMAKATPFADEEPGVIIEDMELDGGTVLFDGAKAPGETMIIWHLSPDEGGAG